MGENGAGKSTLIKLLTGVYQLREGRLLWSGEPVTISNPADSRALGIRVIHQDRTLIPTFNGIENCYLGLEYPTRLGRVDWAAMERRVRQTMEDLGIDLDLKKTAAELSPPQRTELLECIFGYRAVSGGSVLLCGKEYSHLAPETSIQNGMVLISEDRRGKAMIGNLGVRDNILLSSIDTFSRHGILRAKAGNHAAAEQINSLHIKLASPGQRMLELSGGNQQKAAFARALMTSPRIFLCDEPTQAVDVATRSDIHHLLRQKADEGAGVLYVSSDLKELLEVADNILVMARAAPGRAGKT